MILQRNKIKSRKPIIFDIFTLNLPVNGNIIIFAPKFQDHDENINHRRFWLHWQLYRRGSTGKRHGDMGRRAQVQFPTILARRQDTPDRTQSIGQGNVETTTFGTLVRLCSARRWSYQVFARTRLFHHQHRRHSPLGGSLVGTGHAAEKVRLFIEPQRLWSHQGRATL